MFFPRKLLCFLQGICQVFPKHFLNQWRNIDGKTKKPDRDKELSEDLHKRKHIVRGPFWGLPYILNQHSKTLSFSSSQPKNLTLLYVYVCILSSRLSPFLLVSFRDISQCSNYHIPLPLKVLHQKFFFFIKIKLCVLVWSGLTKIKKKKEKKRLFYLFIFCLLRKGVLANSVERIKRSISL